MTSVGWSPFGLLMMKNIDYDWSMDVPHKNVQFLFIDIKNFNTLNVDATIDVKSASSLAISNIDLYAQEYTTPTRIRASNNTNQFKDGRKISYKLPPFKIYRTRRISKEIDVPDNSILANSKIDYNVLTSIVSGNFSNILRELEKEAIDLDANTVAVTSYNWSVNVSKVTKTYTVSLEAILGESK